MAVGGGKSFFAVLGAITLVFVTTSILRYTAHFCTQPMRHQFDSSRTALICNHVSKRTILYATLYSSVAGPYFPSHSTGRSFSRRPACRENSRHNLLLIHVTCRRRSFAYRMIETTINRTSTVVARSSIPGRVYPPWSIRTCRDTPAFEYTPSRRPTQKYSLTTSSEECSGQRLDFPALIRDELDFLTTPDRYRRLDRGLDSLLPAVQMMTYDS